MGYRFGMAQRSSPSLDGSPRLTGYRRLWWATWLAVALPAAAVGLAESPAPAIVIGAIVLGMRVGCAVVGAEHVWRSVGAALIGILLLVAGEPALGPATLPVALLACATSAPVVRAMLRATGADLLYPDLSESQWPADPGSCLSTMSGEELCRLWAQSFTVVRSATDTQRRVAAASLRARLLDELERRDGDALAQWLSRHPSPASEPRWAGSTPPPPPPDR